MNELQVILPVSAHPIGRHMLFMSSSEESDAQVVHGSQSQLSQAPRDDHLHDQVNRAPNTNASSVRDVDLSITDTQTMHCTIASSRLRSM